MLLAHSSVNMSYVYPIIANASLAIELFLKSCLAVDESKEFSFGVKGGAPANWSTYVRSDVSGGNKTHDLAKLFGRLHEEQRNKISSEYAKCELSRKYLTIDALLSSLNGLFEGARYGYAVPDLLPCNISEIIGTAKFLEEVILKLDD